MVHRSGQWQAAFWLESLRIDHEAVMITERAFSSDGGKQRSAVASAAEAKMPILILLGAIGLNGLRRLHGFC